MLIGQFLCGDHDGHLVVVAEAYMSGHCCNHRLAASHIPQKQSIHAFAHGEVFNHIFYGSHLMSSESEGKEFFQVIPQTGRYGEGWACPRLFESLPESHG